MATPQFSVVYPKYNSEASDLNPEHAHNRKAVRQEESGESYTLILEGLRVGLNHLPRFWTYEKEWSHHYGDVQTARLAFDHEAKLLEQGLISEMGAIYERKQQTYVLWSIELWGNGKDGWEFNDRYKQGTIDLPEDPSDDEVVAALKADGWLKPRLRRSSIDIEGDDLVIEVVDNRRSKDYSYGWGQLLYTLELEDKDDR